MPLGGKALKKRQQAADAKLGIVRDEGVLRKAANAKADVMCTVCSQSFKLTKRNVDARTHTSSKHPDKTFECCFPDCVAHEAELAKDAAGGAKGGAGEKKKKKADDTMDLLAAGLAGASVKGKGKGKK